MTSKAQIADVEADDEGGIAKVSRGDGCST